MPTEMDKITAGMVDSRFPKSWLYWFQRLVKLIGQKLDIVLNALGKLPVLNEKGELEASDLVAEQVVQGQGASTVGHVAMFADTTATLIEDAGAALPEPSDTVVSETSYGQDASPGSANDKTYSKGSHTHGTPDVPDFDDLGDIDFTGEAWGDIIFRGEEKWNNLAAGEDGQVFTTHGPDAPPTWEDLPDVGWQQDTDEWIYGSSEYNYFYIADKDVTEKFPPGTKIKLTQTTDKFWYVDSSEVTELGHTAVTLVANSTYTLVDAPITNPCYSHDINPDGFPWDFTDDVATAIHIVDAKTTPADNDELGFVDSAASYVLKKLTWTNLKATLKSYFDSLYVEDIATDIHAADGKTTPADADELGLVDSADSYALKSLTWANIKATLKSYFDGVYGAIAGDGWEKDPDTWVYGSASYFYIAGKDVTARFPRGAKIKLTQGGTVKYWYVNYSEYSYGNTSVAVALTPDYTLANATITSPYYSYASNPQGFPACFNHSDSWDGFSTDPSGGCCNYSVEGGMVTLNVYRASDGTADANNCTINLPLESRDAANYVAFSFGYTVKEATLALGFAYVTQKSYGATLVHAPGAAATDWNTSGNKNWLGQIRYHL